MILECLANDEDRLRRGFRDTNGDRVFSTRLAFTFFIIGLSAGAANKLAISNAYTNEFFRWYFNDLLAGFILIAWATFLAKPHPGVDRFIQSWVGGVCVVLVAAVAWEVIAPALLAKSTADVIDVLMYGFGAIIFRATFPIASR